MWRGISSGECHFDVRRGIKFIVSKNGLRSFTFVRDALRGAATCCVERGGQQKGMGRDKILFIMSIHNDGIHHWECITAQSHIEIQYKRLL